MTTPALRLAREDLERLLHDRALDASARHRARDLARVVHRHRRARITRARALGADDARDRDPLARGPPPLDVVEDFLHRSATITVRASSSSAASEWPFDELVNVRQRGRHSLRQRRVARARLERVHPHDPVRDPREPRHLLGEHSGSPRSHPSERITTTAPRAMPRMPHSSLNARSAVAEPRAARPVDDPRARPRARPRRDRATRARA